MMFIRPASKFSPLKETEAKECHLFGTAEAGENSLLS